MTDFDAALERLVSDPAFRNELANDPAKALAGYRLSPDELDLLRSQVDTGAGDSQHQVETRTSKASLFGLLSPMGGFGGFGDAAQAGTGSGAHGVTGSFDSALNPDDGPAAGHATLHPADAGGEGGQGGAGGQGGGAGYPSDFPTDDPSTPPQSGASFGADDARSGASFGADGRSGASFGDDPGQAAGSGRSGASFGEDDGGNAQASFGGESDGTEYRARHGSGGGLGDAVGNAGDFMKGGGDAPSGGGDDVPRGTIYSSAAAQDYTTRVDANGDGRWDDFTAVNRDDGGVDLYVDRDGDGRAEFVGHDLDRDGLIDEATTDEDGDGNLDTRWVDRDGDGWLDAREDLPAPDAQRSEIRDPRAQ